MGKRGPCDHCGATSTPLWRNGPPGKSVLCNACGSRWRTKGTLFNYTPLHARTLSHVDSDDSLHFQEEKLYINRNRKNWNLKVHSEGSSGSEDTFEAHHPWLSGFEEDTSNRSSSGSAISFSETCVQLGSNDVNDISGPLQSGVFDFHIPSRKRTRTRCSSPSPIEMLRRDLFNILQQQELSHLSGTSEEELIFDGEDPPYFVEIGLGSVLLKPPIPLVGDESEGSSLLTEHKAPHIHEAKGSSSSPVQVKENEINSSQVGNNRLKRDMKVRKELEENSAKPCAVTSNQLGGTSLDVPDICADSFIQAQASNYESTKPPIEVSSCSSYILGGETLLPAKRTLNPKYFQTNEGMGSDASRTIKKPMEQMVTQGSFTSSRCSSAVSHSMSSNKLGSLNRIKVKPLEKGSQPMTGTDVFCPLEEFSFSLTPIINLDDEESKTPTMIFNYSPLLAPDNKSSMEFVDIPN